MNFKTLVAETAKATNFRKADVKDILSAAFNIMLDKLELEGEKVVIRNFFVIVPHQHKGYNVGLPVASQKDKIAVVKVRPHYRYAFRITRR